MRASRLCGWLILAGFAAAMPGPRRRQAQTSTDSCTCPANGPATTTVVQTSIVTSFTTITTEDGTVSSTGPTSTVTVSSTSTTTIVTGTTTITRPGVTQTTTATDSTVTSTITAATTVTTCTATAVPKIKRQNIVTALLKVKRQNSDSSTTATAQVAGPSVTTYTSTYSGKVYSCLCRTRPTSSTLAGTSSCSCPATTATTVTVSSVSTSTSMVTVVSTTSATVVVTPTEFSTSTEQDVVTSSSLATVETTESDSTVTSESIATVFTTFTSTINSCSSTTRSLASTPTTSGGFVCNSTAYLVETKSSVITFYNIDLGSARTFVFATNVGRGTYTTINGIGYNPIDNFIYGIAGISGTNYAIVRLYTSGQVVEILRFTASGSTFPGSLGEIDPNGQFYFSQGGAAWFRADLNPASSDFGTIVDSGTSTLPTGYTLYDWAYLNGNGNYLWGFGKSSDSSPHLALLRWSIDSHTWAVVSDYTGFSAANAIIGAWGSSNSTLWGIAATSGQLVRDSIGGTPTNIGIGPTGVTSADGARCYLAAA